MPRVRKTDTRVPSKVIYDTWNPSGVQDGHTVISTPNRYKSGRLKQITDEGHTQYFAKLKKGEVCMNGVQILQSDISCGDYHYTIGPASCWGHGAIDGSTAAEAHIDIAGKIPAYYASDISNAKGRALIEAYAKMKSPDVLLSVFFQEREKTLELVRRPFGNALHLLNKILSRKVRLLAAGYGALQAFETAWLEARYGWRPTMYDLWGIAKAAAHKKPIAGTKLVARGGNSHGWKKSETSAGSFGGLCDRTWEIKSRVSAGVIYSASDMTDLDWKRRCLGLTLDNVPSHVWEVVPFSFVVDWFYGVGSWLRAATPDPSISILGNWQSVVDDIDQLTKMLPVSVDLCEGFGTPWHGKLYVGDTYHQVDKNLNREVNAPLSKSPLRVETPLSFMNLMDGLFLAHGNIMSSFRKLRL